ncbi:MAG TPA: PQQ-binding-like beta-propeller repeat protein [Polyangia bacterium]|jgi:MYXO-CTERM domain-containing protein|nr:PQQ-binding-like beta-propeller repeat protein [Polyangia bacterium]
MRSRISFALLSGAFLASAPARALDWGTPGLDAAHARLTAERSGAFFTDGRWAVPAVGDVKALASPSVADGFVVTVDLDGVVRALRADTGELAWQVTLRMAVQGTPAILRGRVYVPTLDSRLVALQLSDGAQLWTRQLDGMVMSSPVAVDDDIVLAAGFPQRTVVRLSSVTGEQIWRSEEIMTQFSNTAPAVGGGLVVVGSNGGRYYALDATTGFLRWEYVGDGTVSLAAPLIVGARVYMAGGGSSSLVHAVDLATGTAIAGWPVALPAPDPDLAGTRIWRQRALSSFASAGGVLVLQTRLDDALDTDQDGVADRFLSRETVLGLDPSTGAPVWQQALARAELTDGNDVPSFLVCPTPAGYSTDGASPLLAVASSLLPSVKVLDAATGALRAQHTVAGPALASPVVANGVLVTAAVNGTIEGLASSANHAPAAPSLAESALPLDAAEAPTLRWLPAADPDGGLASYELRVDTDGEVLQTWQQQLLLEPGVTSATLTATLSPGVTYSYAVRARDASGALSPWSPTAHFSLVVNPPVTVDGAPAGSLASAIATAQPGAVIALGMGTYRLPQTITLGAGVSVRGAGAGRTTLDATGLAIGISFEGTDSGHDKVLDGVTVTGADTCVNVSGGATGARLTHVIVRDCRTTGVMVRAGGAADIVNATIVSNPTGVSSSGTARIKNSLLTKNGVALSGAAEGALASSFDDLFDNQNDYAGLAAGTGDLSKSVSFVSFAGHDLSLASAQASTDRGDPADAAGEEPAPNGGRINLGAFGGTADAETSTPSAGAVGAASGDMAKPEVGPNASVDTHETTLGSGGCSVGGGRRSSAGWIAVALLAALAGRRRRKKS